MIDDVEDDDVLEVGVEWVNIYDQFRERYPEWAGEMEDLQYSDDETEGFYSALGGEDWTQKFNWGNELAWECDFEKAAVGGDDLSYIDAVDFAYFSGHGREDLFAFNTDTDYDKYEMMVHYSEVQWGDQDLEWIVISASYVLNWDPEDYPIVQLRWGWPVFHGLHAMLGFHTSPDDEYCPNMGLYFVNFMTGYGGQEPAQTIGKAWEDVTKLLQTVRTIYGPVYGAMLGAGEQFFKGRHRIGWEDYLPDYGYVGGDENPPDFIAYRKWLCPEK